MPADCCADILKHSRETTHSANKEGGGMLEIRGRIDSGNKDVKRKGSSVTVLQTSTEKKKTVKIKILPTALPNE